MDPQILKRVIKRKKKELSSLVKKKQSLLDQEVYVKSCELDDLVVQYMKRVVKKEAING